MAFPRRPATRVRRCRLIRDHIAASIEVLKRAPTFRSPPHGHFRIAEPDVAQAVEALTIVAAKVAHLPSRPGPARPGPTGELCRHRRAGQEDQGCWPLTWRSADIRTAADSDELPETPGKKPTCSSRQRGSTCQKHDHFGVEEISAQPALGNRT